MSNELLIGLGGLVVSGLTYFAGVLRAKHRYDTSARDRRIQHVVDLYVEKAQAAVRSGAHGLHKAGVLTLLDDSECREACQRIAGHGERHPLEPYRAQLGGVDLRELFRLGDAKERDYFLRHAPVDLLAEIQGASLDA